MQNDDIWSDWWVAPVYFDVFKSFRRSSCSSTSESFLNLLGCPKKVWQLSATCAQKCELLRMAWSPSHLTLGLGNAVWHNIIRLHGCPFCALCLRSTPWREISRMTRIGCDSANCKRTNLVPPCNSERVKINFTRAISGIPLSPCTTATSPEKRAVFLHSSVNYRLSLGLSKPRL